MAKAKSATKTATKSATKAAKPAPAKTTEKKAATATETVEETTASEQLPELPKLTEEDRKETTPKKSVTSSALNQTSSANPTGERSAEDQKIMKERLKAKK